MSAVEDAILGDHQLVSKISRERLRGLTVILLRGGHPLGGYERRGEDDVRNGDIDVVERILAQARIPFETHFEAMPRRDAVASFESASL